MSGDAGFSKVRGAMRYASVERGCHHGDALKSSWYSKLLRLERGNPCSREQGGPMTKFTSFFSRFALLAAAITVVILSILVGALVADAQMGRRSGSDGKLIGAPVFAADGVKVGQVVDVSTTDDGRIDKVRITTASPLGFGERTVEIPPTAFVVRGRVVVLDLSAGEVDAFPSVSTEEDRERLDR